MINWTFLLQCRCIYSHYTECIKSTSLAIKLLQLKRPNLATISLILCFGVCCLQIIPTYYKCVKKQLLAQLFLWFIESMHPDQWRLIWSLLQMLNNYLSRSEELAFLFLFWDRFLVSAAILILYPMLFKLPKFLFPQCMICFLSPPLMAQFWSGASRIVPFRPLQASLNV